jgi:protein SCO1/2
MLYCYHYDPSTGKYGAVVMNIMRVAGVMTLLLIGGMLLVLRKIGRRRQAAAAEAISDLRSQI